MEKTPKEWAARLETLMSREELSEFSDFMAEACFENDTTFCEFVDLLSAADEKNYPAKYV